MNDGEKGEIGGGGGEKGRERVSVLISMLYIYIDI
jgi:hypothetical protein